MSPSPDGASVAAMSMMIGAVERDWSAVARAWDARVDEIEGQTAAPTESMLTRAAIRPGDRVLELAAGPGALGATLSRMVGSDGTVVLSDVASGMVDAARRRNATLGNVEIAALDASDIDRPDRSFEVVVCRMGLMFTPHPSAALAEIRRVLVPGGRVAAVTWAGIEHNPWMSCVGLAASAQGLVGGGPPVGPGEVFSLGDAGTLEALFMDAGFIGVGVDAHEIVLRAENVDAHVERICALAAPMVMALRTASPVQLAGMRRIAAELAGRYVTRDGVALPGRALLVWGTNP